MGNNSSFWTSHWPAEAFFLSFFQIFFWGKVCWTLYTQYFPAIFSSLKKALLHCIKHKEFEYYMKTGEDNKILALFLNTNFCTINLKTKPYWVKHVSAAQAKVIWIGLNVNLWRTNSISHDTLFHPQGCDQDLYTSLIAGLRSVEMFILWNVKARSWYLWIYYERERESTETKTNSIFTDTGTFHPGPHPTQGPPWLTESYWRKWPEAMT